MIMPLLLLAAAQAVAAAPAAVDFTTAPMSPGSWGYVPIAGGSEARFVDSSGTIRLVLRCDRPARRITLSRISTTSAPSLQLWTSSAERALPARFEANIFRVSADLAATDPLLDAVAFSRGRIAISMAGAAPLVVPAWAEPARAIEDCRS